MTQSRACSWPKCISNLIAFGLSFAFLAPAAAARLATCDARALGATGDGRTKDTAALQKAIDRCTAGTGGVVHLTAGTYLSGPLALKSHVHLALDKGAMLLGSPDMVDYPIRKDAKWRRISLLSADHVEDIAITGEGTIDGNGKVWWDAQLNRQKGTPENPRPLLIDLTEFRSRFLIERK